MLNQLFVKDFAIVDSIDIDYQPGMTTITGETGAGKSISIDALGLCLGNRAEATMVKKGASKLEISASFCVKNIPNAKSWLTQHELIDPDENECVIRRTVTTEGRSRAYINGAPATAQQLKSVSQYLVNIHGQHAHQQLIKSEHQLALLDDYAGHNKLLEATHNAYQYWLMQCTELKKLKAQEAQRTDKLQLIEYQVAELDDFALQIGEFEQLEDEHKRLSNATSLITESQMALTMLYDSDEHSACGLVQSLTNKLSNLAENDPSLSNVCQILEEANIQLQEASSELRHYIDTLEPNPERLQELDDRLSLALDLARKHKVPPEQLAQEHERLNSELKELKSYGELSEQLDKDVAIAEQQYWQQARTLSESRSQFAKQLSKQITHSMQELNMAQGQFKIAQTQHQTISKLGSDQVEFLVSANLGQDLQPINKVASGGELSRISLAIQVITAERVSTPTLIFDEVDVGISGQTAAIVGKMLKRIGENTQVICVTHLPQVAACGHQQMQVAKHNHNKQTVTNMEALNHEDRVFELARLLGGDSVTETAIANAKDLLHC